MTTTIALSWLTQRDVRAWRMVAALAAVAVPTVPVATMGCSGQTVESAAADASFDTGASADARVIADASDASVVRPDTGPDVDAVADVAIPPPPGPDGAVLTGPWLAFASNRLGTFDIYLVRPDGSELHPLVQGPGNQLFPAWSPDGQTLAFASDANGGNYALFLVDAASGVVHRLANDRPRGTAPSFSPDGKSIVFGGDGPGGGLIYRVSLSDGAAVPLTSGTARDGLPVWAPDGSLIYFSSDRTGPWEIWSVKPDGTGLQRVTTGANLNGGPTVSADGKTLAYATATPASGDAGAGTKVVLYTLATKTASIVSAMRDSEPSFARTGSLIGVTSLRFGASNPEIVLLDTAGVAPAVRVTNDPATDTEVAFRPTP
jgi:Tol biopolymer transport system component